MDASCLLFHQVGALSKKVIHTLPAVSQTHYCTPEEGFSDPYANLNYVKYSTCLHITLDFKRVFLCMLVDFGWTPSAPDVCLNLYRVFHWEGKCITRFLSHGIFYYVVGNTPEKAKKWREKLNWIAFINQCHIMHSGYRLAWSPIVYKQKVQKSFENPLVKRSLASCTTLAGLWCKSSFMH